MNKPGMVAVQPGPPRQVGEILHATGELENAVEQLHKSVCSLSTRLNTVLAAEPPTAPSEASIPETASELGRRLHTLGKDVDLAQRLLTQLEERIQL